MNMARDERQSQKKKKEINKRARKSAFLTVSSQKSKGVLWEDQKFHIFKTSNIVSDNDEEGEYEGEEGDDLGERRN
jgi:hypothetical protein